MPLLMRAYFCCIARIDNIDIFYCHIASMQATSIASDDNDDRIFMSYRDEWTTIIQYFHRIACKQAMTTWYCKEQASARRIARTNSNNFVFYCHSYEEQWRGDFFTCRVARSDCNERFFYVILQKAMKQKHARAFLSSQGCKRLAAIAIHDRWLQEGRQWLYFLCQCLWCCEQQLYCQGACHDCDSTIARREDATIKLLYAVDQMMTVTCVPQGSTMVNKGWLGAGDCAKQQPNRPQRCVALASGNDYIFTSHREGEQRQQKFKHWITIKILHAKGLLCNDWFVQATVNNPPDLDQSVQLLMTVYSIKLKGFNHRTIIPL